MALFKRKKEKEVQAEMSAKKKIAVSPKTEKKSAVSPARVHHPGGQTVGRDLSTVLRRPRITEKATFQAERHVYVFEIAQEADKRAVAEAIKYFYKVVPRKVHIVPIPAKTVMSRKRGGVRGKKSAGKKAYVFLMPGDKIEII